MLAACLTKTNSRIEDCISVAEMADSTTKILSIVIFLVLISQGYGQCSLSDISVSQRQTGGIVKGRIQWSVTISNKCSCGQKKVTLNSTGFGTTQAVDPAIFDFSTKYGYGLVNSGNPIYRGAPISFDYAWNVSFPLPPISAETICS